MTVSMEEEYGRHSQKMRDLVIESVRSLREEVNDHRAFLQKQIEEHNASLAVAEVDMEVKRLTQERIASIQAEIEKLDARSSKLDADMKKIEEVVNKFVRD